MDESKQTKAQWSLSHNPVFLLCGREIVYRKIAVNTIIAIVVIIIGIFQYIAEKPIDCKSIHKYSNKMASQVKNNSAPSTSYRHQHSFYPLV